MSKHRALCWTGSTVIMLISLALLHWGGWTAIIVSFVGQIGWGVFTAIKGWRWY